MTSCDAEDKDEFNLKVAYSSGLSESDFAHLKCIPKENFTLFNEPEKNLANSIGLLFEQCGGKNSKEVETKDKSDSQAAN